MNCQAFNSEPAAYRNTRRKNTRVVQEEVLGLSSGVHVRNRLEEPPVSSKMGGYDEAI